MAAAFTAYDSETEYILTKDYGELFMNGYAWGPTEDGGFFTERKRLNDHICTLEELSYGGDPKNHRFFPVHAASEGIVKFYQKKFLCLEPEDLLVYGDYNTGKARQHNVQLKKCVGHDYCRTPEEITAFFRNKFILLIFN